MAILQNNDENNNENAPAPVMTGGGTGSLGAGGTSNAATPSGPQSRQGSGRFTNLNKYVTANKQGSENLANRLGTGISNQLDTKEKDASSSLSGATSAISGEGGAKSTLSGLNQQKDTFKGIASQFPQNQVKATDELGAFTKAPEFGNYMKGLSGDAIDEGQLQSQVSAAGQDVSNFQNLFKNRQQQATTGEGRQQLLGEFVGGGQSAIRPAYSAGQKKLDQLVLQQNPDSIKQFLNVVNSRQAGVDALNTNLSSTQNDLDTLAADEQSFMTGANADIGEAKAGFLTPLEQRSAQMNKENPELIARAQQDLTDETISGDLLSRFGLNEGQQLYGLNLNNYLNADATKVGINQAATDQERKYFANLSNLLSGQDKTLVTDQGKNVSPVSLDMNRFNQDLAQADAGYKNAQSNELIEGLAPTLGLSGKASTYNNLVEGINNYRNYAAKEGGANAEWANRQADLMQQKSNEWAAKKNANRKVIKG